MGERSPVDVAGHDGGRPGAPKPGPRQAGRSGFSIVHADGHPAGDRDDAVGTRGCASGRPPRHRSSPPSHLGKGRLLTRPADDADGIHQVLLGSAMMKAAGLGGGTGPIVELDGVTPASAMALASASTGRRSQRACAPPDAGKLTRSRNDWRPDDLGHLCLPLRRMGVLDGASHPGRDASGDPLPGAPGGTGRSRNPSGNPCRRCGAARTRARGPSLVSRSRWRLRTTMARTPPSSFSAWSKFLVLGLRPGHDGVLQPQTGKLHAQVHHLIPLAEAAQCFRVTKGIPSVRVVVAPYQCPGAPRCLPNNDCCARGRKQSLGRNSLV